jgi:hypothetical protein
VTTVKRINITLLLLSSLTAVPVNADLESEAEALAIEKAHAAVSEVEMDFRKALEEAVKKGELKKALPGCRIKNLGSAEIKVGRTSHRLRNTQNAAPEWTKRYLNQFANAKPTEIPKHVLTKISKNRYGYIKPIFVQPICLNCHGRAVTPEVQEAIRVAYPNDKALNFDLGDFRGVLWLEMKD